MNQIIKAENVDLKSLIEKDVNLSINFKSKILDTLANEFTYKEQKWYIANLYIYLNFHPTNDYPINLENVYKLVGFTTKANAKRTLLNNFTADEDYKINIIPRDEIRTGPDNETIMLNTNTFKGLCMLVKTDKAKDIRKYYIKLENIFNKIVNEERSEYENKIKEQQETIECVQRKLEEKDLLIENLENKPETEGFFRESGEIYIIKDSYKVGHYKIGFTSKSDNRVEQLNVASSTKSLELYTKFNTFDKVFAEKIIHHSLHPFRIRGRKEWFYFRDDLELAYAINTIKKSLEYIDKFNIKNYNEFKECTVNLNCNTELVIKELNNQIVEKIHIIKKNIINGMQQGKVKSGTFKGCLFVKDKQLWKAELQNDYNRHFLGYFSDEIDAAKVYNDYAMYLNVNKDCNFLLNEIPGYITVPRNIPELNKLEIETKKSSKYTGVSYDSKRKFYVASIKMSNKTFNLGSNIIEIECAKLYNQQAMYFNNTFNTIYKLNELKDYVTVANDLRKNTKETKTSKFYGVSLTKDSKWACSYTMNRKKIHIGTFNTELEACLSYNQKILELNKNGSNYKVNLITESEVV